MQRISKVLFVVLLSIFFLGEVSAKRCENAEQAELNNLVSNIKVSYEEAVGELSEDEFVLPDYLLGTEEAEDYVATYEYLKITIVNITEEFYVEVTNDYNNEKWVYRNSDTVDGNITIDWEDLSEVTTFTFRVYSSDKTGCANEVQKTLYLTVPRFNQYYYYSICGGAKDYHLCQKYVTSKDVDFSTFMKNVEQYMDSKKSEEQKKKENLKWHQKMGEFITEHKVAFIVGGTIIVVSIGVGTYVIIKKRRSREL